MSRTRKNSDSASQRAFLRTVTLKGGPAASMQAYPFSIAAIRALGTIELHPQVTLFVGENGSGKSTLIEAIAIASGFNPEGGTKNFSFSTRRSESELSQYIRIARGIRRERTGFFLRAESFFNVATEIERLDREGGGPPLINSYGGKSLHEQSHGESFLALAKHRFGDDGLYILDEPEAALSPSKQLALLACIHDRVTRGRSQFLIATHSPIVLAYPGAAIYQLSQQGVARVEYEETEHFALTRDFLQHRERFFRELFREDG